MSNSTPFQHRPEIDGLRALAVLPVILFHAGIPGFAGGFVGVDVFFVISGFLITSILIKDRQYARHSIARFYERRARRILPALFFVMLVILPFALFFMVPSEQYGFGQSILSVLTFCSNIFFWTNADYFSPGAELQPLLHTWSLAVEEQYYLFFPILLAGLWRLGLGRLFWALAALALVSLAASEWGWRHQASANFYLLPTRAWELLAGSLWAVRVSQSEQRHDRHGHWFAGFLACLGLVCLVTSIAVFNERTPFPSLYSLLPVVGTLLIIANGNAPGPVRSFLSWRPMVKIGLLSYSAYLWHQPLFAMVRLVDLQPVGHVLMFGMSVLSLGLAYLSWRFVEQPFRNSNAMPMPKMLAWLGGMFLALLAYAGACVGTQGFYKADRWRAYQPLFAVQSQSGGWYGACAKQQIASPLGPFVCRIGAASAEPSGVLWGDSIAGSLIPGLHWELSAQGRSYLAVISNGCVPIPGIQRSTYQCNEARHLNFLTALSKDPNLKEVVWSGHFLAAVTMHDFTFKGHLLSDADLAHEVGRTLDTMRSMGKKVVLVGQNPIMPFDAPTHHARQQMLGLPLAMAMTRESNPRFHEVYGVVRQAAQGRVEFVDTLGLLCIEPHNCPSIKPGVGLMYSDAGHVSYAASGLIAKQVLRQMK